MTYEEYYRRLYHEFNQRYFAGELEEDIEVIIEPCGKCDDLYGYVNHFRPFMGHEITIDDEMAVLHDKWARIILLHEMIHIKLHPYGYHGKPFYDEFLRLANMGAYKTLI